MGSPHDISWASRLYAPAFIASLLHSKDVSTIMPIKTHRLRGNRSRLSFWMVLRAERPGFACGILPGKMRRSAHGRPSSYAIPRCSLGQPPSLIWFPLTIGAIIALQDHCYVVKYLYLKNKCSEFRRRTLRLRRSA